MMKTIRYQESGEVFAEDLATLLELLSELVEEGRVESIPVENFQKRFEIPMTGQTILALEETQPIILSFYPDSLKEALRKSILNESYRIVKAK